MEKTDLYIEVNSILAKELGLNSRPQSNLVKKQMRNWDSLKHITIVVSLETALNVYFEPEEIVEMNSTEDIVSILLNKKL